MLQLIAATTALALLVGVSHRAQPKLMTGLSVAGPMLAFAWLASHIPAVVAGDVVAEQHAWAPRFGVSAAFLLDALSLLFALVITGIGALVNAYAIPYMHGAHAKRGRLLALLLCFQAAMLGVVLADDVLVLYVCWELTSISSFFLIGFESDDEEARGNALQALIVTSLGGLALLTGLLLLGVVATDGGMPLADARRLSELHAAGVPAHGLYLPILLLVTLGAFTKSAHVPFHFWLPAAMVAPTPVSAYLHSATMVKAGLYLLARFTQTLGGTEAWTWLLGLGGGATMLVAAIATITQRDLKLILAYSTLTVLGALTMLLGLGHDKALNAFVLLLLAHALYKAALFMVAGNVDHATGSRDAYGVGPLSRALPGTAAVAAIAAASMAGMPLLLGFLGKEALYLATLKAGGLVAKVAATAAVTAGSLLVAAALIVAVAPFFRRGEGEQEVEVKKLPHLMSLAPGVLSLATVALGALSGGLGTFTDAVTNAIAARPVHTDVALWHGIGAPYGTALTFSVASVLAGLLGYWWLSRSPPKAGILERPALRRWTPSALYDRCVDLLFSTAETVATSLQSGKLRIYLGVVLLTALGFVGLPLGLAISKGIDPPSVRPHAHEVLLIGVACLGAVNAVRTHHRLVAIASLGATGFSIAFLFALLSAPDLAITQLMVETLVVIIAVLVFRRIPPAASRRSIGSRSLHALIAAASGALVSTLVLAVSRARFVPDAAEFFVEHQRERSEGGGVGNVVNAILAEYRALDTLGEITVLATAGIGVYTLLRMAGSRKKREEEAPCSDSS